jgi:hypothetical protein
VSFLLQLLLVYDRGSQSVLRKEASGEAGVTFDNSFFGNSFVLVQQLKNRLFLGPVFVHVTGRTKN